MNFTEFVLKHGCNANEIRELRMYFAFLRMKDVLAPYLK